MMFFNLKKPRCLEHYQDTINHIEDVLDMIEMTRYCYTEVEFYYKKLLYREFHRLMLEQHVL
jgi:hypothetical protein